MSSRPLGDCIPLWQQMRDLQREGLRIIDISDRLERPTNSITYGLKRLRELGL